MGFLSIIPHPHQSFDVALEEPLAEIGGVCFVFSITTHAQGCLQKGKGMRVGQELRRNKSSQVSSVFSLVTQEA